MMEIAKDLEESAMNRDLVRHVLLCIPPRGWVVSKDWRVSITLLITYTHDPSTRPALHFMTSQTHRDYRLPSPGSALNYSPRRQEKDETFSLQFATGMQYAVGSGIRSAGIHFV